MSLRLRQAIPGRPRRDSPSALSAFTAQSGAYFIYPSSSNVVLLDPDGDLHSTLPFWDALPHRAGPSGSERDVGGVLARGNMVLAWSGPHVVLWSCQPKGWTVHSTIVANSPVTSLDLWGGTLALGTETGVELWHTENADVVVWDRIWIGHTDPSPMVALPPEQSHVAWYFKGGREISIRAFDTKGVTGSPQILRQPREIEWLGWRTVETTEAQLYVITTNCVLRIYATVLDDPTWFQMLYAIDHRAFRDAGVLPPKGKRPAEFGTIWVPDGATLRRAAKNAHAAAGKSRLPGSVIQILDALEHDEADIAVWFGPNSEVVLRSIFNLDRAPPTLIKSEPLASFITPINASWSSRGCLLDGKSLFFAFPPTNTQPDVSTVRVSLLDLFAGNDESFEKTEPDDFESMSVFMTQDIECFARTPNGRGLLAIGKGGEISVWEKRRLGKTLWNESKLKTAALVGKGQWMAPASPILYAIYAKGRGIASYYNDPIDGPRVVLRHLDPGVGVPTEPVVMPHFEPKPDDKIELLLALSDIDDGYSPRRRRTRRAVIMAVSASGEAWVWRIEPAATSPRAEYSESSLTRRDSFASTPQRRGTVPDSPGSPYVKGSLMSADSGMGGSVYHSEKPIVTLISHSFLPVEDGKKPRFILPVDPMGWHSSTIDWETDTPLQDMVVTLSESGVLEFWTPRLGQHLAGQRRASVHRDTCSDGHTANGGWARTSVVRTEKTNVCLARTSSRKKTALVCAVDDKYEVTIWDSNVSEFSTGLELTHTFDGGHVIQDLDWTTTSDLQSVLAVGFPHQIVLVCEQRLSYVDVTPGWAPFLHVDMRKYTSVPINDSVWVAGGSLAVAAGNQVYVFSRFLDQPTPSSSPPRSADVTPTKASFDSEEPEDIFQLIAHENGPLFDFHPTMLHQCLMWDKIDLVKDIIVTLVKDLRKCQDEGRRRLNYQRLDPLEFHQSNAVPQQKATTKTDYSSLFSIAPPEDPKDDDEFTESLVQDLIERLDGPVAVPLNQFEKSSLAALAQAVLEVEASRRSLDICGLRYLISIRAFANRDRRFNPPSGPTTPLPIPMPKEGIRPKGHMRISFRNIVWATHSESQVILLQAATASTENNKMTWEDAKRLGVFLWLRNQEEIRATLEIVARNRFMGEEDRDPVSASLFFFALGKKQVVHGLWRQAPGHKEQAMMLKFLSNDFSLDRWKTAAAKNAYALLSKQRYEYAAAFFMLAGKPKDAITVCLRQLGDWQLAVALARAVEGEGPLLSWVLTDTVLPIAFGGGHRWLASWALWMLKRRDLSVRVIVSPMEEVAAAWNADKVNSGKLAVGPPDNDDPSLLLLFQHLKSKTLQTAMGTNEITPALEFDFVVHNARVFFRMGCHPLGLDVLRSWSFERAWFSLPVPKKRAEPIKTSGELVEGAVSPTRRMSVSPYGLRRRSSFMLSRPAGRENMLMDMDVVAESTEPPTRLPSPAQQNEKDAPRQQTVSKPERTERPELMKDLRKDVEQGGAAFDMDTFFAPEKVTDVPGLVTSPPSTNCSTTPALMTGQATPVFGVQFADSFGGGLATTLKPESVSPGSPGSRVETPPRGRSPIGRLPCDQSPARTGTGTPLRKGANLMKEMMAGTQAEQGGEEFSFDSFFSGSSAPRATKSETDTDGSKDEVKAKESMSDANVEEKDEPRKGLSLMKDNNAHTQSAQGATEFNFDSFTPAMPAPSARATDKTEVTSNGDKLDQKSNQKPNPQPEEDRPKGLSLMKEANAHTQSAQGATEFSFDGFFPSEPVQRKPKPAQEPAPEEPNAEDAVVNTGTATPEPDAKPTASTPSTSESDSPKTTDADTLPNTSDKATDTSPATPDPEPRKGANLMKDLNPNATAAQGGTEFNFSDFGF